jgi:TonB family protein
VFGLLVYASLAVYATPAQPSSSAYEQPSGAQCSLVHPLPGLARWSKNWGVILELRNSKLFVDKVLQASSGKAWRILPGDEVVESNYVPGKEVLSGGKLRSAAPEQGRTTYTIATRDGRISLSSSPTWQGAWIVPAIPAVEESKPLSPVCVVHVRQTDCHTVVIEYVSPASEAESLNIGPGDEVSEIGGLNIEAYDSDHIEDILQGSSTTVTVLSGRSGGIRELTLKCFLTAGNVPAARSDNEGGTGQGALPFGCQIATRVPYSTTHVRGNIAPYRKAIISNIARNWHRHRMLEIMPTVVLTIGADGALLGSEISQSSGNRKVDAEALRAVQVTEFPALPDWYRGEQLQFKIPMDKVAACEDIETAQPAFDPHRHARNNQLRYTTTEEMLKRFLIKVKGNWNRAGGPIAQFRISKGAAQITIAKSSGDAKLDDDALFVLNHTSFPSLDVAEISALEFKLNLAAMGVFDIHKERMP